jgi:hypothetical protein
VVLVVEVDLCEEVGLMFRDGEETHDVKEKCSFGSA